MSRIAKSADADERLPDKESIGQISKEAIVRSAMLRDKAAKFGEKAHESKSSLRERADFDRLPRF